MIKFSSFSHFVRKEAGELHRSYSPPLRMLRPNSTKQNNPSQSQFSHAQFNPQFHQQNVFTEQRYASPSPQNVTVGAADQINNSFIFHEQQKPGQGYRNHWEDPRIEPESLRGAQFHPMHQQQQRFQTQPGIQQPSVQNIPPEQLRQMGHQQQQQYSNSQYMQNNTGWFYNQVCWIQGLKLPGRRQYLVILRHFPLK